MDSSTDQAISGDQPMFNIERPHHNDVLSGRGVTTNRHEGNSNFRGLVALNKVRKKKKDQKILGRNRFCIDLLAI
jgi:hypothetical protein